MSISNFDFSKEQAVAKSVKLAVTRAAVRVSVAFFNVALSAATALTNAARASHIAALQAEAVKLTLAIETEDKKLKAALAVYRAAFRTTQNNIADTLVKQNVVSAEIDTHKAGSV